MPFKSKAQQRFMFAAEERGEIPKGTAKRWAKHTPSIKKLPEHVKKTKHAEFLEMAYQMGVKEAMVKEGLVESALGSLVKNTAPLWAPAAAGAYMAGPDQRGWGALAGLGAGAAGRMAGRALFRNARFLPEELSLVKQMQRIRPENLELDDIQKVMAKNPDLAAGIKDPAEFLSKIKMTEQQMPMAEWAGRLGAAGGAGYLMSRAGMGGRPMPPGYLGYGPDSYSAPAVTDMSSYYMGMTPNG